MQRTDSNHNKWLYEQDGTVAANTIMMRSGVQFVGCNERHSQMEYMTDPELEAYMKEHNLRYRNQQISNENNVVRGERELDLFEVMNYYAK